MKFAPEGAAPGRLSRDGIIIPYAAASRHVKGARMLSNRPPIVRAANTFFLQFRREFPGFLRAFIVARRQMGAYNESIYGKRDENMTNLRRLWEGAVYDTDRRIT